MRTITIEVDTGATVTVNGAKVFDDDVGATAVPAADEEDTAALRHDTPKEVVIAATCHAANRQYRASLGEDPGPVWSEAPGAMQASVIETVRAIAAGTVRTPEDAHALWMARKLDDGWVYGPEQQHFAKTHPALVAFGDLPPQQRAKDRLLFAIASTLLEPA